MINPALAPPIPCEIDTDKSNGKGYWAFMPANPVAVDEGLAVVREYGHLPELETIVDAASADGSTLVQGQPGSGKSHLVRELQEGCMVAGVPCFCLTVHINGAKASGIETVAERLNHFREATAESGGVVILDNVDFLGYNGHGRSKGATRSYANAAAPVFKDLIADPKLVVVGLSHDDAWQESHWTTRDPSVDGPAGEVLDSFRSKVVFEGKMALTGLVEVIRARSAETSSQPQADGQPAPPSITVGQAARVVRQLHNRGLDNFFHANHVDPALFLANPEAALEEVESGRVVRTSRKKV